MTAVILTDINIVLRTRLDPCCPNPLGQFFAFGRLDLPAAWSISGVNITQSGKINANLCCKSHFEPTTTQGTSASPLKSRILSYTICIMSNELREAIEYTNTQPWIPMACCGLKGECSSYIYHSEEHFERVMLELLTCPAVSMIWQSYSTPL